MSNRFDELGRWAKVLDGRAGEFAVLPTILCVPELERDWVPPFCVGVVQREGLNPELTVIHRTWTEGV